MTTNHHSRQRAAPSSGTSPDLNEQERNGGDYLNKNILESVMKRHGDTGGELAAYLGMARSTFSMKINETETSPGNNAEFTQGEIMKIKQRYNLTAEELDEIFFATKVS